MIQTEQTQLTVELGVHDTHRASFENMIANGELTLKGKSVNKDKHPMIHEALQGSPAIWIAVHVPKSRVDEDTRDILESRRFEHLSFSNNSRYGSYRFMMALKTLVKVLKKNSDKEWKFALLGTESYTQEDSHPIVVPTRDLEDQGHELYQMEDMESGKFLMNFTDLDGGWTRTFDHFEFCIEASELKFELHKEVRVYRAGLCNDSCITCLQTIGKCSCPNPNCAIVALEPCNSVSELFDKEIPAYFEDESLEVRIAFKDEKQNLIGIQDVEEPDKIIVVKFDCMKEAFKILKKGQIIQLDDIYRLPLTDCSVKLMNEKLKTQRVSPFCIYRDDTMRVKVKDSLDVSDEVIELDREIKLDLNQDIWHRRNKGIIESIHSIETYVNEDTLGWNLNPAQEHALKQVLDGKNALILGEGGTG